MRCDRHGLAGGPDGRCALCASAQRGRAEGVTKRARAEQKDHSLRFAAKIVVAVVAGVMAFCLLLALFDTK